MFMRQDVEQMIYTIRHAVVPELQNYIEEQVSRRIREEEERINAKVVAEVLRMRLQETLSEPAK